MERRDIRKELQDVSFNNLNARQLSFLALFIALAAVATYIRVPGFNASYYNLGEVIVFTVALIFGRKSGLIAGAIGSSLVDLLVAPVWVPFTFVIKGLEGWVVGSLAEDDKPLKNILAVVVGGHIMIIGYAVAVWILYGWPSVLPEIGGNYFQALIGAVIAWPLSYQIRKIL
ncbi:MAG: ECF transporter S component [Halothermotrichaceae bacterium]